MTDWVEVGSLRVAETLLEFVDRDVLPGSGLGSEEFWTGFEAIVHDLRRLRR